MPAKVSKVHFASVGFVRDADHPPSPTFSHSSGSDDSLGPFTPPPAHDSLPPDQPTIFKAIDLKGPRGNEIPLDITMDPSESLEPYGGLADKIVSDVKEVTFGCTLLPWPITVKASNGKKVSFRDVICGVHNTLKQEGSGLQGLGGYDGIPKADTRAGVKKAQAARIARETRHGRRARATVLFDHLQEKHRFNGVTMFKSRAEGRLHFCL